MTCETPWADNMDEVYSITSSIQFNIRAADVPFYSDVSWIKPAVIHEHSPTTLLLPLEAQFQTAWKLMIVVLPLGISWCSHVSVKHIKLHSQ